MKLFIIFGIALAVALAVVGYVVGTQFGSSANTDKAATSVAAAPANDKPAKGGRPRRVHAPEWRAELPRPRPQRVAAHLAAGQD